MTALIVVETVVLLVLCVLVAGLLRAYADVLRRLHALDGGGAVDEADAAAGPGTVGADPAATRSPSTPRGAPAFRTVPSIQAPSGGGSDTGDDIWRDAHDIAGETPRGELVHTRLRGVAHDTLVAFLSSGCTGCVGFWEELAKPGSWSLPEGVRLLVVSKGADDESPSAIAQLAPRGTDVVMSSQAWADYEVPGSPYVVVVDGTTGKVKGEGSGGSFSQIGSLVAQASGDTELRVRKPVSDRQREAEVDAELRAAGIHPGDPSLYGSARSGS